jgi:hypothetical protein
MVIGIFIILILFMINLIKFNKPALYKSVVERGNLLYSLDKINKIEENKITKTIRKGEQKT